MGLASIMENRYKGLRALTSQSSPCRVHARMRRSAGQGRGIIGHRGRWNLRLGKAA